MSDDERASPHGYAVSRLESLRPIVAVAHDLGVSPDEMDLYGHYKAKLHLDVLERMADKPDGKLILMTGITPTAAGEGKTTVSIGLTQGLQKLGKAALVCLREPSLGPLFGVKGGATGGGGAQVVPMADINLHFTGDFHAVGSAHNLLAAMVDNHLHHGNSLGIDPRRVSLRRTIDMNDRSLRNTVIGLGAPGDGFPRQTGFDITPASEVMAILCLAQGIEDLKQRLARVVIGQNYEQKGVTAAQLHAENAMALLLRDALKPNLVQTLEGGPAIVHGGPFANIAHGCSSVLGTRTGLKLADYVVTEAGFAADLGAEKFFDIKCRTAGLTPSAVVIVASIRALKRHGAVQTASLDSENAEAAVIGCCNLEKHVENMRKFGLESVVALNRFPTDTDGEIAAVIDHCRGQGVRAVETTAYVAGGNGAVKLAGALLEVLSGQPPDFRLLYEDGAALQEKIKTIAVEIYGASGVTYSAEAQRVLGGLERNGHGRLPICVAKTQYSFSDNPRLLGRPEGFQLNVREVRLSAGAGFVVALTGDVLTMPGLPSTPAAERIGIDDSGQIYGLR